MYLYEGGEEKKNFAQKWSHRGHYKSMFYESSSLFNAADADVKYGPSMLLFHPQTRPKQTDNLDTRIHRGETFKNAYIQNFISYIHTHIYILPTWKFVARKRENFWQLKASCWNGWLKNFHKGPIPIGKVILHHPLKLEKDNLVVLTN